MRCTGPDKPRQPRVGLITAGLILWFVLCSLVMGFITNHAGAARDSLLSGLDRFFTGM